MTTIRPATLAFDASGTPCSTQFGDVYHSAASGPAQSRHVFLHGNDLPARWRGSPVFTIVELGFGIGLNFLATWEAWRSDPQRCGRLHFVSIERHPFAVDDLATLHARYREFSALSVQLRVAWPPLLPGFHRLHFDEGKLTLTLVLADVAEGLRDLRLAADAFYLDGFAPDRNHEMWSGAAMKALTRIAKPGATVATWSVAGAVRDALTAAGFQLVKRAGFAAKREMLVGRFAPRWTPRRSASASPNWPDRHAIVVGAGLAGAAIAVRLAARGWRVDVVERRSGPACGASGIRAGVFQPHLSRDDSVLSRFTRAGFLYAQRAWPSLEDVPSRALRCGVLQLADGAEKEARVAATAALLCAPREYAEYVSREAASVIVGARVLAGGWWFPGGGYVAPAAVVHAQLAHATGTRTHLRREIAALESADGSWQVRDGEGTIIATAPVVVLANAHDALGFAKLGADAIRLVRGQQTYLPTPPFRPPQVVVGGDGYVVPAGSGIAVVGATYDLDDMDPDPDPRSHVLNLERAERMLPGSTARIDRTSLSGGVGFRCVATDRLPLVGAMVDIVAAQSRASMLTGARPSDLPRIRGIYALFAFASRGLAWTMIAAEALASALDGEPLPMEGDLVDAIDPGRFAMHRLRRGKALTL